LRHHCRNEVVFEYTFFVTQKNPFQADQSVVDESPSPTERTPHKPNVAAERARLFLANLF